MWLKSALAGLALIMLSACQVKPDLPEQHVLSPAEVRALFSGNTVEASNLLTGTTSFTYYAVQGELYQERYWERRTGRWHVNEKGEICLQFADKKAAKCRSILLRNGHYYKQRPSADGGQEKVIRYRQFIPGNMLQES